MYDTATIDIQIRNVNEKPRYKREQLNRTIFITNGDLTGSNVGTPFKHIVSDPEGGSLRFEIVCPQPIDCRRRPRSSLPYDNFDPLTGFSIAEESGQIILRSNSLQKGESEYPRLHSNWQVN